MDQLVLTYSNRQAECKRLVSAGLATLARTANPDDMEGWWATASAEYLNLVRAGFVTAQLITRSFLMDYGGLLGLTINIPFVDFDAAAVLTSGWVTGPVAFWTNVGYTKNRFAALQSMISQISASGVRHSLDGGRSLISQSSADNRTIKGWKRRASADACDFCTDQAARDVLFSKNFRCHDSCACVGVPVFTRDAINGAEQNGE
jgi:hypothetical protein